MKVIDNENEIILRDVPATNWAYGFLSLLGVLIFGVVLAERLQSSGSSPLSQLFVLAIVLFFVYLTYLKLSSPVITTHVLKKEKTIEVTKYSLVSFKKTEKFKLSQIRSFELESRKPDRAILYFNVMVLRDGRRIDLESSGHMIETSAVEMKLTNLLKASRKRNYEAALWNLENKKSLD